MNKRIKRIVRKEKIHCIVQARIASTRLPAKIFLQGCGKSLIDHLIERLECSKKISKIIVATTKINKHNFLKSYFSKKVKNIFYGSEKNVLERYYKCAKKYNSEIIIRITSDCPLMDYRIIDKMIKHFKDNNCDYLSNTHPRHYPIGFDVEIFKISALKRAYFMASRSFDKEHVTPFIWKNPKTFKLLNFKPSKIIKNHKKLRLTLDYLDDYILILTIFTHLYKIDKKFSLNKILKFLNKYKTLLKINKKHIKSNERYFKQI